MIRVGDLTQFSVLKAGSFAHFDTDRPRNVKITFNAPQRTIINLHALRDDGRIADEQDPYFLAVVEGLEDVEFFVRGAFAIEAEADRVWLKTVDGQDLSFLIPDAETFTRISERRVRNPEMERLQEMLIMNEQRRMAPFYAQLEAMRQSLAARETEHQGTPPLVADAGSGEQPQGHVAGPAQPVDTGGGASGASGED